jgi:hypothetical protein
MILEKERFEAWLEQKPDDRTWDYLDIHGCVVCSFIKETSNARHVSIGPRDYTIDGGELKRIPQWLYSVLWSARKPFVADHGDIIHLQSLKDSYTKLFPQDTPQPQSTTPQNHE